MKLRIILALLLLIALSAAAGYWYYLTRDSREPSRLAYAEYCAGCHGNELQGAAGPALTGQLKYGDATSELIASIAQRHDGEQWSGRLPEHTIKALALYVSEQRQAFPAVSDSYYSTPAEGVFNSALHRFKVEEVARFATRPYSMAPLPDGRVLVNERTRGLSFVSSDGLQGNIVSGTPEVWEPLATIQGSEVVMGVLLDVELHPDYENNGWVYLSYGHLCLLECNSLVPQTMVRVVRGRIENGQWQDQELIWSVHSKYYTVVPDNVASGRLALDGKGYVYVTVGGKGAYKHLHDLNTPYGKIHRVADDGTVPTNNPFWQPAEQREHGSTRHTVFSYGHRTAQGLTAHPVTGAIWSTEMGPRGGDEVNLIRAGGNYGWPLYTNGLDYDGEPLTIGVELGLNFSFESTVAPVVDFTPAPALSNLSIYHGNHFQEWQGDLLVGSLRANTLYRVRVNPNGNAGASELEKLHTALGRIRDVEIASDGTVYVLSEDLQGGALYRLSKM